MTSTRTQPIAVTTRTEYLDRVHRVLLLTQLIVTGVAVIALVTLNALDVAPIVVMVVVGALICAGLLAGAAGREVALDQVVGGVVLPRNLDARRRDAEVGAGKLGHRGILLGAAGSARAVSPAA